MSTYVIVQLDDERAPYGPGTVIERCESRESFEPDGNRRLVLWRDDAVEPLEVGARVEAGLVAVRRTTVTSATTSQAAGEVTAAPALRPSHHNVPPVGGGSSVVVLEEEPTTPGRRVKRPAPPAPAAAKVVRDRHRATVESTATKAISADELAPLVEESRRP